MYFFILAAHLAHGGVESVLEDNAADQEPVQGALDLFTQLLCCSF